MLPASVRLRRLLFGADPKRTLFRIVLWGGLGVLLVRTVFMPIKVIGSSMSPTYANGAVNLVNRLAYSIAPPERGDVVALRLRTENDLLLKRIIGLPNEKVSLINGRFRINGRPLDEVYTQTKVPVRNNSITLGPDEYFVIGDNRTISVFGPIKGDQIVGKVLF